MDSFSSLSDDSLNINISGAGLWYLRFKGWLFTRGPCAHDAPSWICGLNMNSSNQYEMRWKTHVCFILARSKNVISYSHNLSRHRCVCHMNSFACYTRWFVRSLQILRFFLSWILFFFVEIISLDDFLVIGLELGWFGSVSLVIKLNYYGWDRCVTVCICNTSS